ncbi:MAG: M23 family metallopeptidase [Turicibacter sp.]|nr:M23 family metallopeptidase [Turicibacter sp.]
MKRIKKFFKKADPVTMALVGLLVVSSIFAWVQIAGTGGDSVPVTGPASTPIESDAPVFSPVDVPVFGPAESFIAPIAESDFTITTTFFDEASTDAAALASSIFYFQIGAGKYSHPSNGASFSATSGDVVDVVAPLSGTVSGVIDNDPVRGTIVTIDHDEGIRTVLTGVYNVNVVAGDDVDQGDVLGVTGLSRLEPDSGNVVHLEVIQSGNYINPESIIGRNIDDL